MTTTAGPRLTSEQSTELFKPHCVITPEYFQAVGNFTKISRRPPTRKCASCSHAPRNGVEQCAATVWGALAASNSIRCYENNIDYGTNAGICARFAGAGAEGGIHDRKGQRRRQGIARQKKEAQEQRAKVKITEGSLDMPNRFTAGEITFAVTNNTDEKRGFRIAGKGIRESLGKIKPGETSTLTVKLEPDSYTASCPEHRGEQMTFKVTEK